MKNVITGLVGLSLITASVIYYVDKEDIPPCGHNKDTVISNFQEWLTNGIAKIDKRIAKTPIQIVDVVGIMEYNQTPEIMDVPLYENFKDSRICKGTLLVDFTPNGTNRNIEEIDIRFQKVLTSPDEEGNQGLYTSVSGYDINNMIEQGTELFNKYHKK